MTQSQPPITRTTHTLPFDKLSPRDFERLCLWLVEREGYKRAEHLGAAGSEQGRDIVAWREGVLWAFQCKRVRSFGPKNALAEVEKVLALPEAERPVGLVFLVTCDVSANTRQQARERCAGEMECHFWAGTELDEKVEQHPDIVKEFFADGHAYAEITVSATASHVTDSTVITAGRDVIIYESTKPVSAGGLLDACQAQVKSVLYDVRHKYDPNLYVNRAIERELNHFFDTPLDGPAPNCFLLVAPAGSGKTNLLCEVARVRMTRQPVLLLMGGNLYIGATTGLLGAIQAELETASSEVAFRSAGDSLHTLHRLAEELNRDALLFLDAINEHYRPVEMRKAVEDLLRKTREKRIKLVITCRDYYWGLFRGRFWEGATVNELPAEVDEDEIGDTDGDFSRFAADEHERALPLYLDHHQITGRPIGDAAEQCRHPLLLRFFCEAYRGQDIGEVEDIRLKELFDRYWSQKLISIAERMIQQGDERLQDGLAAEVTDYLLNVAAHMLHQNVRAIPLSEISQATGRKEQYDDPRSVYGRIRDEFIILEEKERGKGRRKILQVAFVYEEFMEYVMASSLIRDWLTANLDEEGILAEIESLTGKYESFAQIVGVMVYLGMILKEDLDLALWPLLLNRGERWQKVVFEAIRKLPEEQLDTDVFATLEQMLTTDDEGILKQVLDTLKVKRVGQAAPASVVNVVRDLATHEQESIARRAVLALGNTMPDLTLPVLTQAVSDPRLSVRRDAIRALGQIRQLPDLAQLGSSDWNLRSKSAEALGELRDARAVEPLIATLRDSNRHVRAKAAEALGKLGEPAVEPLIAALKDVDSNVRAGAAKALGKLGEPAVEPLIAALKDVDPNVRAGAAEALGKLGDKRAVEPLNTVLKDSREDVWSKAAGALGELGDKRAVELLIAALGDSNLSVRVEATEALGKSRKAWVAEPLIATLGDSNRNVRMRAAKALVKMGKPVVELLIAALKDVDSNVRLGAAEVLGKLGDARAVEPLIVALKDVDSNVRAGAAEALGKLGDTRAVEPLIVALKESNRLVRAGVAEALRELGDARAVEPLIATLKDSNASVRARVAKALGRLGDARAVEPLIAALKDSDWEVQRGAAEALGKLGSAAVESLIAALKDNDKWVRLYAAEALGKLGDARAMEPLIAALKDSDEEVRQGATRALGQIWQLPDLTRFGSSDWHIRRGAAEALGKLGDARAVEPLIAALKHSYEGVRQGATRALGHIWQLPKLTELGSFNEEMRLYAAEALGKLGDARAVEPPIAALKDSDKSVRLYAAEALGKLGSAAVEPLIAALKDSNLWVRRGAAEALGKLGDARAVEPLIAALKDSDWEVRRGAAEALGKLGDTRAVEPFITALKDSDSRVRSKAAKALGILRDARAVEPLIAALKDSDWGVRWSAAAALRRIGTPKALAAVREYRTQKKRR